MTAIDDDANEANLVPERHSGDGDSFVVPHNGSPMRSCLKKLKYSSDVASLFRCPADDMTPCCNSPNHKNDNSTSNRHNSESPFASSCDDDERAIDMDSSMNSSCITPSSYCISPSRSRKTVSFGPNKVVLIAPRVQEFQLGCSPLSCCPHTIQQQKFTSPSSTTDIVTEDECSTKVMLCAFPPTPSSSSPLYSFNHSASGALPSPPRSSVPHVFDPMKASSEPCPPTVRGGSPITSPSRTEERRPEPSAVRQSLFVFSSLLHLCGDDAEAISGTSPNASSDNESLPHFLSWFTSAGVTSRDARRHPTLELPPPCSAAVKLTVACCCAGVAAAAAIRILSAVGSHAN